MSIVSADVVDETVKAVGWVWRHEKGRALAMIVGALAVVCPVIVRFIAGPTAIQAASVGTGLVVFGLAALAPYAEMFRPVPPPPLHPIHRDDVITELEAIMLDRFSKLEQRVADRDERDDERDEQIYRVLDRLGSASAWFASEVERALADLSKANS